LEKGRQRGSGCGEGKESRWIKGMEDPRVFHVEDGENRRQMSNRGHVGAHGIPSRDRVLPGDPISVTLLC
jgi:hypothetical protein